LLRTPIFGIEVRFLKAQVSDQDWQRINDLLASSGDLTDKLATKYSRYDLQVY
jgi:hypothetical protein